MSNVVCVAGDEYSRVENEERHKRISAQGGQIHQRLSVALKDVWAGGSSRESQWLRPLELRSGTPAAARSLVPTGFDLTFASQTLGSR